MRAIISTVYVCLLVLCPSLAQSESETGPHLPEKAEANNGPKADEKQEDVIDRIFSPLDNAVSDINRDLNKGDGSATPETSE